MRKRLLLTISARRSWRCSALQPMKASRALTFQAAAPKSRQAKSRTVTVPNQVAQVLAPSAAVAQIVVGGVEVHLLSILRWSSPQNLQTSPAGDLVGRLSLQ